MSVAKKELKTFRVEVTSVNSSGPSTYYGRGEDAHEVFAALVAHDDREGNWSHQDAIGFDIQVEEIGENEKFVSWSLGS